MNDFLIHQVKWKNVYFMNGEIEYFHFTAWNKNYIHEKNFSFLLIIYKLIKSLLFNAAQYRGPGLPEFYTRH